MDVVLGLRDGRAWRQARGPSVRNGRGQRAARAMVLSADTFDLPAHGVRCVIVEGVDNVNTGAVPAGGQYRFAPAFQQVVGSLVRVIAAPEHRQFNTVWRNHFCQGKQLLFHGANQFVIGQVAATCSFNHRVGNHGYAGVFTDEIHQHIHHCRIAQRRF